MKLSIIIPTFNEEKTIKLVIEKVKQVKLPKDFKKEIIVVDDGSSDQTEKILKKGKEIKYFRHNQNLGKGAAVRTGIENSTGEWIIIQDGDLEYDPVCYSKLLEPLLNRETKVVYGTRLINYPLNLWGSRKTVLPMHLIANKLLTIFTNILYGSNLTDMETGYKLFRSDILKKISLKSNRFDFEPEITAKILKLNIPIVEIPIKVRPRSYEEGKKIGFIDGLIAIITLIKYRITD